MRELLTRRLDILKQATLKVAAGDLDVTVDIHGSDEIAVLAGTFDEMTGRLKSTVEELRTREKELRESEERLRFHADNSPMAVVEWNTDFIVTRWTGAAEEIFGWSPEETIGKPIMELRMIYEEDIPIIKSVMQRLTDGKSRHVISSNRNYTKKREVIQCEWYNSVLSDSTGKMVSVMSQVLDITDRKLAEKQLRESLEQLRRAMQTTIQVLVMAVEMKDPYTAGHQRRATNLARTMATEMGLPPEKIEGLLMAGVIHDIGKITLPTQILSKPAKLSAIELSLIREHVRLGYDILKDVESPWPLAEIVRQHHERMDGSGYPRGLKWEEILIEARILAVADVVEAMASHRPYRPALGLDAALEEIEKNRGLLYDSHAVDACLRVFREKGYQIEET